MGVILGEGKARVNITLSEELKNWYQGQAKEFGCTMASMMVIALAQYKQQTEGLNMMKDMGSLFDRINEMQNVILKEGEKNE